MPWWGAVVIAVTATIVGFAFDAGSGNRELTSAFSALYFIGCVAAVLAVRQSGVFTAVVQPPLILFVAVPGAYFLFHQSEIDGIKDILINCGYPLIERFLLMFTTSVLVLLIGAARWYFGRTDEVAADAATEAATPAAPLAGLSAKLSSLFGRSSGVDDEDDAPESPRKHGIDRPATASRRSTARSTSKQAQPTRSRHARPPIDDLDDNPPPPPRRRRPPPAAGDEPEPRRRPRAPREPGSRNPSREYRPREREPREREPREPYDRPRRRPNPYDPADSFDAPGYDAQPPRPRRPAASSGPGSTHHPVSRVRYRGSEDGDDRVEYRTPPRPKARHSLDSDRWPD